MNAQPIRRVGILVFDGVEVLDFCGPFEVFSVARPPGKNPGDEPLFEAVVVAEEDRTVACTGGLLVKPHATIEDHSPLDVLVVPGGRGTWRERTNGRLLDWIEDQNSRTGLTISVCTGAFLLAERGLLDGRRATTHWASVELMRKQYPLVETLEDTRVVDEGRIVTSAGISAGIDMSLRIVGRLHGREVAEWTARLMEYDAGPVPAHRVEQARQG